MLAAFNDAPLIEHQHAVGADNGRQAMGHHEHGALAHEGVEGFLHEGL